MRYAFSLMALAILFCASPAIAQPGTGNVLDPQKYKLVPGIFAGQAVYFAFPVDAAAPTLTQQLIAPQPKASDFTPPLPAQFQQPAYTAPAMQAAYYTQPAAYAYAPAMYAAPTYTYQRTGLFGGYRLRGSSGGACAGGSCGGN